MWKMVRDTTSQISHTSLIKETGCTSHISNKMKLLILSRLLHPRDDPGRGEGAGPEVHPSDGQAAGSLQRDPPCQVDRGLR